MSQIQESIESVLTSVLTVVDDLSMYTTVTVVNMSKYSRVKRTVFSKRMKFGSMDKSLSLYRLSLSPFACRSWSKRGRREGSWRTLLHC